MSAAVARGDRNDALEQRLRTILQAGDFPALSKLFAEAMSISADEDASSQRLANLVLRDYSLTVKVIRTGTSTTVRKPISARCTKATTTTSP